MADERPEDVESALQKVMTSSGRFGHREHIHLAWLAIRDDPATAEATLDRWLRTIARHHGTPDRFHVTVTRAWVALVRHHLADDSGVGEFEGFIERNAGLLDSSLVGQHYQPGTLATAASRTAWVPPDRLPLPA